MDCPSCYAANDAAAMACAHCGEVLQAEAAVPMAPARTGPVGQPAANKKKRPVNRLTFHGSGGAIFGMHLINVFLSVLTFGIYSFWGKAKVRSYMFSQMELRRQRFAFHGTGLELFLGRLKFFAVILAPGMLIGAYVGFMGVMHPDQKSNFELLMGIPYLTIFCFMPFAVVGAQRYLLSRTSWAGIRFSFRGTAREYFQIYVAGSILTGLTLGLYSPVFHAKTYNFLMGQSYFGNRKFEADADGKALIGSYLLALVLTPFTLGLSWFWYFAKVDRQFAERTRLGKVRFRSTVTGGSLAKLKLVNGLLTLFTAGLASPWVQVRSMRYTAENIVLVGELELDGIQQDARGAGAFGEEMADAFGVDMGLAL